MNAEFQRKARRDKKAFLSDRFKEIEEKLAVTSGERESRGANRGRGLRGTNHYT